MSIFPVILCGGGGARLWPLSRGGQPKQFLALAGDRSLFQATVLRGAGLNGATAPVVVSNIAHRFHVMDQLKEIDREALSIVLEPTSRNTAAAIAAAAHVVAACDPDATMLVLPSDHIIANETAFRLAVGIATPLAHDGYIVTFGIVPSEPRTGFGYIRRGAVLSKELGAYRVDTFIEKPDAESAESLIRAGDAFWNSGMFALKAKTYLDELQRWAPAIASAAHDAFVAAHSDDNCVTLSAEPLALCPNLSIDHAVLEKSDRVSVVTIDDLGWNDIGSWSALGEVSPCDEQGNVAIGDVFHESVSGTYIRADHRMVAAVGVTDLVIVETADAVLVAGKNSSQDVKAIVERLKADGRRESITHTRVNRPWGSYESIADGPRFQVKRIVVAPGGQLSLQLHHHRAEHWIVVKGTAHVVNGDQDLLLTENESTYIPVGTLHRLTNPGKLPLELIEVQSGPYLGEDDIVRLEDRYGRVPEG